MGLYDAVIRRLRDIPQVMEVIIPDRDELDILFREERSVKTMSGVPMINRALEQTFLRKHHIIFIESSPID